MRGIILTGFPWNLIVFSLSKNLNLINIVSVIGTYSLNLIAISIFILPALLILRKSYKEIYITIFILILPLIFINYGIFQKKNFLNKKAKENSFIIRAIGSNIDINRFYNNSQAETVINELISISSPISSKKIFFIWPEGIIPNTYQDELILYNDIINKNFNENHFIGLGITDKKMLIIV